MRVGQHWVFDLDGTLTDSLSATRLRPGGKELLEELCGAGARVSLWSAGGACYARRVAERLGISHCFGAVDAKLVGGDGRWLLPAGWDAGQVTCVDDDPDRLPGGVRPLAVRPWLGGADAGLARLADPAQG